MNKSILITGCSSGIGLCAAKLLRERGYRVFATARKAEDVATLAAQGYESLQLDVNDSASIYAAVAEISKRTGNKLDALLNNAGFGQPGAVEDLTRDALRNQFETNLFGLVELMNQIIPLMRAQGHGRIINVSSVLGLVAFPYNGAYDATKFAVEGITDALRLELYGSNIHVSLIEPGPIASKFRHHALEKAENINIELSPHRIRYEKMHAQYAAAKPVPFTLPPEAVVKKLIHALESKNPRPRYYVTVYTYLLGFLKRVLWTRALDWVVRKIR